WLPSTYTDVVTVQQMDSMDFKHYDLMHIRDLNIIIPDFIAENGQTIEVLINVYVTNHVYTRKPASTDKANMAILEFKGRVLKRYKHLDKEPSKLHLINGQPQLLEQRIFDETKYQQSLLLPSFIDFLEANLALKNILANSGNDKTCLTALFNLPHEDDKAYMVLFHLDKLNGSTVNMLIETGYIESIKADHRLQKIINNDRTRLKPFVVLVKNILAGRKPFEGPAIQKRKRSAKKNKKNKESLNAKK
ncbi:MAG: hypothetical protein ACI8WB_004753, partial [Phenylobacterium sp.]